MVYEFSFDDLRPYKHEATIDFTAKPINEFENTLIDVNGDESLLPVCTVYGPNGGGKSSVLMALYSGLRSRPYYIWLSTVIFII